MTVSRRLDVEEHERAVVAPTGEIEAGDELKIGNGTSHLVGGGPKMGYAWFCGNRGNLRVPLATRKFLFFLASSAPAQVRKSMRPRILKRLRLRLREPREPQNAPSQLAPSDAWLWHVRLDQSPFGIGQISFATQPFAAML